MHPFVRLNQVIATTTKKIKTLNFSHLIVNEFINLVIPKLINHQFCHIYFLDHKVLIKTSKMWAHHLINI